MPIPDLLNSFLRDPLFADDRGFPAAILASARSFAHILIATHARTSSHSRRPAPAETKLIRRTERLLRERRTGAAMQSAEQLQDLINRDLITEAGLAPLTSSYSLDTVRSTLALLCPPASDKDTHSKTPTLHRPVLPSHRHRQRCTGSPRAFTIWGCCRRFWMDLCRDESHPPPE